MTVGECPKLGRQPCCLWGRVKCSCEGVDFNIQQSADAAFLRGLTVSKAESDTHQHMLLTTANQGSYCTAARSRMSCLPSVLARLILLASTSGGSSKFILEASDSADLLILLVPSCIISSTPSALLQADLRQDWADLQGSSVRLCLTRPHNKDV